MTVEGTLIALRKENDFSQEYLAKQLGISVDAYRNKELGKTDWKGQQMFAISLIFDKPIEYIFYNKSPQKVDKPS